MLVLESYIPSGVDGSECNLCLDRLAGDTHLVPHRLAYQDPYPYGPIGQILSERGWTDDEGLEEAGVVVSSCAMI